MPGDIFVWGLIPRLCYRDYDVVVGDIFDIFSFIITKLRGKAFIIWSEGWKWQRRSLKYKLFLHFMKVVVSHSDAFLVPGIKHKEYISSLGAPQNKVFIMPSVSNIPVNRTDYKKAERWKTEHNVQNKRIILFVGRLVEVKGVQYLIQAFAMLKNEVPDVVLVCVGDGNYKEKLKSLCRILNIERDVYFVGWVRNEYMAQYYLICDAFVLPSITAHGGADAWGLVANEAMYFGKPVICTNAVGAAYTLIKDGVNGFIVPEKSVDGLYEAMMKILSDSELEKKMRKESKRIIEAEFTYKHMVDGFREAIEYAIKRS